MSSGPGTSAQGAAVAEARRAAGLTEKDLAERLGVSLWEVERLELGKADAGPYLAGLRQHTGLDEADLAEPTPTNGAGEAQAPGPVETSRGGRLDGAGRLVLGSIAALVLIRFLTEEVGLLPRALNFIDIPILIALGGAAVLSSKPTPPLDGFARLLLPLAVGFVVLCAVGILANQGRVEAGPAIVFAYGVLAPLAVYRAVLRLWTPGRALAASHLIVALGVIQLVVAIGIDLPQFISTNNPDVISGTFGTNPYQFVFFMTIFIALLSGIYSNEPRRAAARLAPLMIGASLVFIVLAQYRAALISTGLSLLVVTLMLARAGRGPRNIVAAGVGVLAFMAALAFAAEKVPVLKLGETAKQDPRAVIGKRVDVLGQVSTLYEDNPTYLITGTGPGTFSSRGWQTFALSDSDSKSNVQGGYAQKLTGGVYRTDVSDRYVRPALETTSEGAVVAGSRAANSPYSSYTSVAAEVGILGVLLLLAIYLSATFTAFRRAAGGIRSARPGDPLPALLLGVAVGFFMLIQMGVLDNWLEVTRATFVLWALAAIANKELQARSTASPL